jgi:hypothetical protein
VLSKEPTVQLFPAGRQYLVFKFDPVAVNLKPEAHSVVAADWQTTLVKIEQDALNRQIAKTIKNFLI